MNTHSPMLRCLETCPERLHEGSVTNDSFPCGTEMLSAGFKTGGLRNLVSIGVSSRNPVNVASNAATLIAALLMMMPPARLVSQHRSSVGRK